MSKPTNKDLLDRLEKLESQLKGTCPSCGYCPTCGHRPYRLVPQWVPYDPWRWTWCTNTGSSRVGTSTTYTEVGNTNLSSSTFTLTSGTQVD